MAKINLGETAFDTSFYEKAIDFLTDGGIYQLDSTKQQLVKTGKSPQSAQHGIVKHWLIFSTGTELLLKAVFLRYECDFIQKNK